MKKKFLLLGILVAGFCAAVITCSLSMMPAGTSSLQTLSRSVDQHFLAGQAYMGGSLLYNPDSPSSGHLMEGAVVALRFANAERIGDGEDTFYTDKRDSEEFASLTVDSVDESKIVFSVMLFSAGNRNRQITLRIGENADLNGDGVEDILYHKPAKIHSGFEHAVYLTLLSSPERLTTAMFAVIAEQYENGAYPSGIIGINPDGKFVYSKYEPNGTARSAVSGLSNDDFVLDGTSGTYIKVSGVPAYTGQRSIADSDLAGAQTVDITEALPLASWNAGKIANGGVPVAARSYEEYNAVKKNLSHDFGMYRPLITLPTRQITDKVNEFEHIALDTSVGLYGRFAITWSHVESDLMAGVYFSGELDLTVKEAMTKNIKTVGPYKFDNNYNFAVGPIPVSLACPVTFEMPIDVKVTGDPDSSFVVSFTGIYGGGVDAGAHINWDKLFKKGFVKPFAKPYAVTNGIFYVGSKTPHEEIKTALNLSLEVSPEISVTPKIGIAGALWTGLTGTYQLPAAIGISVKEDSAMTGWIALSHKGSLKWYAGLQIGSVKKEFQPTLFEIGPSEIKKWNLFSAKVS